MGENTPFAVQSRKKERDNGHDSWVCFVRAYLRGFGDQEMFLAKNEKSFSFKIISFQFSSKLKIEFSFSGKTF